MALVREPVVDEDRLRRSMKDRGIDLVLATGKRNVGYLTDHQTDHWNWEHAILHMMEKEYDDWDYQVMAGFALDEDRETFLVEYAHRQDAIRRSGVTADYYGYWRQGRNVTPDGPAICLEQSYTRTAEEAAVLAIKERGLDRVTIGVEMARVSAATLSTLRDLLPHARFVDAFEMLFDLRQIKTPEEVRRLRHAYNVATEVYRDIFRELATGMSPREILRRELDGIYRRDCSFSFAHIFFGSGATDIAFTPSADRSIEPGDVGLFDLGVVYRGYGTDFARMAQAPPPNADLGKYFQVVRRARGAVEAALVPGAKASDVFLAGARVLEEAGCCAAISTVGHGIGLGCHERPFLSPFSEDAIAAGQTLVIEIYCEIEGIGPVLLEDGGLMTEEGWQPFSDLPQDIIEVSSK